MLKKLVMNEVEVQRTPYYGMILLILVLCMCITPVQAAKIIWVSDSHQTLTGATVPDDQGWVDLLRAEGYDVDQRPPISAGVGPWRELDANEIAALEAADLIIVSRDADQTQYANNAAESTQWNSIKTPLILMQNYIARSSRWRWLSSTSMAARQNYFEAKAVDPNHPVFAGVQLDPNGVVTYMDSSAYPGHVSFINIDNAGHGKAIAVRPDNGNILIAEWEASKLTFYNVQTMPTFQGPGGKRMLFNAGTQETSANIGFGVYNLTAEGQKMFLNAVAYMLTKPKMPFSDDFQTAHDYLTEGLGAYDGMLNGTVSALDANNSRAGSLYMETANASWDPGPGPLLYVNVTGDFVTQVLVTDFAGTLEAPLEHNAAGILARNPASDGGVENWISVDYFPTWTGFIVWNTTDGVRAELGQTAGRWDGVDTYTIAAQYPYLQLKRVGSNFYPGISADGVNFIPLTDPAYQGIYDGNQAPLVISRPDLSETLQVGLQQMTFTPEVVYAAFDDFSIRNIIEPVDPGNEGLVAAYKFENDANDSSGNGLHGTVFSGEPNFVQGHSGKAIALDGVYEYVDLPIGSLIGSLGNSTFAAWVNWSGTGGDWQRIFDFGTGEQVNMFLTPSTWLLNSVFVITTGGIAAEDRSYTVTVLPTGWHHVAVTIDADNKIHCLHLDGELVAKNTAARHEPSSLGVTTRNWLGRSQYAVDPYFNGSLDEFYIYNRVLSLAEILYLASN
jgi:hypothetical protein